MTVTMSTVCVKRNTYYVNWSPTHAPIYTIDHVKFWRPSPRATTKKIGIKCAQTVDVYIKQKCLEMQEM